MVMLGNISVLKRVSSFNNLRIYMNSSFKSASSVFYMLYIIHAEVNGQNFPLVFSFLNSKSEETYAHMLKKLVTELFDNGVTFYPDLIQIDFEIAASNAIKRVFPLSTIKGCFFHFGQCVIRKISDLGLRSLFNTDMNFKRSVQFINTLALIPLPLVDEGWRIIKTMMPIYVDKVVDLIINVKNTWLIPNNSVFNRAVWSHNSNLSTRKKNALEGFHAKLNRSINKSRPAYYEVVDKLKKL
ncbi:hypothetical protein DMUE_0791 [Dictyocoela muelleri]|nr:hypothetical protein DMUE_0791 [Dictyocoela muelleri]